MRYARLHAQRLRRVWKRSPPLSRECSAIGGRLLTAHVPGSSLFPITHRSAQCATQQVLPLEGTVPLPVQPKVVIIGAGIVGCALSDELTARGWTDVTVLE